MKSAFVFLFLCSVTLLNGQSILDFRHPSLEPDKAFSSQISPTANAGKKSPALAIFYSALLPGMGELYAGTFSSSGKYFTMAEGTFLVTYIGMNSYSKWQKENYKSFAALNGSVPGQGFSDDFYADISNYSNIKQFNDEKTLNGQTNLRYDPAIYNWNWPTETTRKEYRTMWVASQQANNNLRFVIGAMLLNRLVSVVNAVRSVTAYNRSLDAAGMVGEGPQLQLSAYQSEYNSIILNCRYNF
jgi:hypothetical protein